MKPYRLILNDALVAMRAMAPASVDAIVSDPPYGLAFMGKSWDTMTPRQFQEFSRLWAVEALRVLKPGGYLLAFAGSRTYHRLVCGVEDAGFEIRDCLMWIYGSGFPKSLNVSVAIDKSKNLQRRVIGKKTFANGSKTRTAAGKGEKFKVAGNSGLETAPASPEAQRWAGWGTALKPAYEPILMARKPLAGNVVQTVLKHGTGALNIDACRIGAEQRPQMVRNNKNVVQLSMAGKSVGGTSSGEVTTQGRWPANVCHDGSPEVLARFPQSSITGARSKRSQDNIVENTTWLAANHQSKEYVDSGSAARFFYCPKVSRAERHAGLTVPPAQFKHGTPLKDIEAQAVQLAGNKHPTVKPQALMLWLIQMVTRPGGIVLDPFMGSGSTGAAAVRAGFRFIGIEREREYALIARARIAHATPQPVVPSGMFAPTTTQAPHAPRSKLPPRPERAHPQRGRSIQAAARPNPTARPRVAQCAHGRHHP